MELREHISFFWKKKTSVILVALVTLFVSLVVLSLRPVQYDASLSFSINLQVRQQTPDYQYDDYYAIKSAELVGDTIMSWFVTPAVVADIYGRSGVEVKEGFLSQFSGFFHAKKYSAQTIAVSFHYPSSAAAEELSQSVIDVVEERAAELNNVSNGSAATYLVTSDEPYIVERQKPFLLVGIVAFFTGLIAGLAAVYTRHYLAKT